MGGAQDDKWGALRMTKRDRPPGFLFLCRGRQGELPQQGKRGWPGPCPQRPAETGIRVDEDIDPYNNQPVRAPQSGNGRENSRTILSPRVQILG